MKRFLMCACVVLPLTAQAAPAAPAAPAVDDIVLMHAATDDVEPDALLKVGARGGLGQRVGIREPGGGATSLGLDFS